MLTLLGVNTAWIKPCLTNVNYIPGVGETPLRNGREGRAEVFINLRRFFSVFLGLGRTLSDRPGNQKMSVP